jgi:hypothetical protein
MHLSLPVDSAILLKLLRNVLVVLERHLKVWIRLHLAALGSLDTCNSMVKVLLEGALVLLNLHRPQLHLIKKSLLSFLMPLHVLKPSVTSVLVKISRVQTVH